MRLTYIGKDSGSGDHGSPTAWVDQDVRGLVLQGWRADEETEERCRQDGPIPDHETIIRIPASMIPVLKEALRVAESQ